MEKYALPLIPVEVADVSEVLVRIRQHVPNILKMPLDKYSRSTQLVGTIDIADVKMVGFCSV
jgi:hypothetical protein